MEFISYLNLAGLAIHSSTDSGITNQEGKSSTGV